MKPVTDPALLAELNGTTSGPVTDPAILAELNGEGTAESPAEVVVTAMSPKETSRRRMGNRARAVFNAATFQFGDEMEAAARAAASGRPYRDVVNDVREDYSQYRLAHPGEATALELAGGIGSAFIPGVGLGGKFVQGALGINKIASPILRAGTTAAVEGGLTGLGTAEDKFGNPSDTAAQVALGAGMGLGTGTAAAALPKFLQGPLNLFNRRKSEGDAAEKALEITSQALRRDDATPFDIYAQSAAARAEGAPITLADTGGANMSKLTETVLGRPSKEGGQLTEDLITMQQGSRARVQNRVGEGVSRNVDYDVAKQDVTERLRNTFNTAYRPAYAVGAVDDPTINQLVNSPSVAPFWGEVMKTMRAKADSLGVNIEDIMPIRLEPLLDDTGRALMDPWSNVPLMRPAGGSAPTVEALDLLKKAMDDGIDARFRQNGVSKTEAGFLRDIRNGVVNRLDDLVPEYRAARAQYRGDAEVRSAYDMGMGVNLERGAKPVDQMRPQEFYNTFSGMSQAEQEALRVGYGNKLINDMAKTSRNRDWAGEIINNPNRAHILETMYPDPNEFALFEQALRRESKMYKNRGKVLGGSPTAGRLAAKEDFDNAMDSGDAAQVLDVMSRGKPGVMLAAGNAAIRFLTGKNYGNEVYNQVAKLLRNGTPEEIAEILTRMRDQATKTAAKEDTLVKASTGIAGGSVGSAGTEAAAQDREIDRNAKAGVAGSPIGQQGVAPEAGIKPTAQADLPISQPQFENLVGRVIHQESGGDPNAVSGKGAKGLMQVMHHTGFDPGMGVTPMRNESPEENLRFGQDYLAALLKRYQDVPTALAAYNWGLGNVDEWVAGGRKGKLPEETQTYIRNIVGE